MQAKSRRLIEQQQRHSLTILDIEDLKQVSGGRATVVTVDRGPTATVDDFAINMDIFTGHIKGPMLI